MVGVLVKDVSVDSVLSKKVHMCPFYSILHYHTFLFSSSFTHSSWTSFSCTPYLHPFINLLLQDPERQFSVIYIVCSTKVILWSVWTEYILAVLAHLWFISKPKQLAHYPTLYVLPGSREVQMDSHKKGNIPVTLIHHIYKPTPIHMFPTHVLSFFLCVSFYKPFRQKGLLCKCTSE